MRRKKGMSGKSVGSWQLAVGSGQWAVGSWQLAVGSGQWAVGSKLKRATLSGQLFFVGVQESPQPT